MLNPSVNSSAVSGDEPGQTLARRGFVKLALGAMAIGAGTGLAVDSAQSSPTITDNDILNFLLNLHYWKANYYSLATSGATIPAAMTNGVGTAGLVLPGRMVPFSDGILAAEVREDTQDELAHVNSLRIALGSAAVAQPRIDLSTTPFTNIGIAAGLIVSGQTFDPYASDVNFLVGALYFADLIVAAYHGVLPLYSDTSAASYRNALQGIMAVEAYHAAVIRTELYSRGGGTSSNLIAALQSTLAGIAPIFHGIALSSGVSIANVDANGIVFSATTRQALNVVYGAQGASSGLFFPVGVNGVINS